MKRLFLLVFILILLFSNNYSQQISNSGFELGSYNGFYTLDEVYIELDSMRMLYPNLVSMKDSIGTTWEGRTIWAVKLSANVDNEEDKPEVFLNSLAHGVEPMSMMVLMHFMYYLIENYEKDPTATYILDNREIYCIPVFNPDGYFHHERKNRRENPDSSYGVDLNRNFGYMWGVDDDGSKPDPSHIMYRGPYAFSEPESRAIRDFCNRHSFITANNMHYYGYWLYIPFGYNLQNTPDSMVYHTITKMGTEFNGYDAQLSFHPVNGTVSDWMYGDTISKPKIIAITTEVGGKDISNYVNPTEEDIWDVCLDGVYQNIIISLAPGIAEDVPYISNVKLDKSLVEDINGEIKISVEEKNNLLLKESDIKGLIFNEESVLVDSISLQYESLNSVSNLGGTIKPPEEEGFYTINIVQKVSDLKFPLFYNKQYPDLKFVHAGPFQVSINEIAEKGSAGYWIKFAFTNLSEHFTFSKVYLNIDSPDTTITAISPKQLACYNITPGESRLTGYAIFSVDSNFSKVLNLTYEVEYEGVVFWRDTLNNYLITDLKQEENIPGSFKLSQNYPNPFNPVTTIEYAIPLISNVDLSVYNILGEHVVTLVSTRQLPGNYPVQFDGSKLPSGLYFYRLSTENFIVTKKLVLIK
jgi:hypothetical protein